MRKPFANHWQRLTRISQLPPHQHHQGKTEEEENQARESVLDTDYFVVGRENIFSPPPELVMLMSSIVPVRLVMRFACRAGFWRRRNRSGSIHFKRKLRFNI